MGLFDERCPEHQVFSLPSEWFSASPTLSRDFSNHKDLNKMSVENIKSLMSMQDFGGREVM